MTLKPQEKYGKKQPNTFKISDKALEFLASEKQKSIRPPSHEEWKKTFRLFYNDNESGGSSRWLVTPMTVEVFIIGILEREREKSFELGYKEGCKDSEGRE